MSSGMYKDSPSFKILLEPNSSKLLIPNEFVRKHGDQILPQEAFLMTNETYGTCWKVKIARLDSGCFCIEDGWPKFVDDNRQVCASDFAVFRLVDATTFHVSFSGKAPLRPSSSTPRDAVRDNNKKKRKAPMMHVSPHPHKFEVMHLGVRTLAPSFIKILILPNFNRRVGVPPYFSVRFEENLSGGKVTLRIDDSDKTWDVKVGKMEDGRYEFARGWDVFVEDVGLQMGEIVVFKLVGDSTFDVSTYGTHEAEWKSAPGRTNYEEELDIFSFSAILRKHHENFMNIPMEIAVKTGIIDRDYITLRNENNGKSENIRVSIRAKDGRVGLRGGWNDYWRKYNLSIGNEVIFKIFGDDFGTLHLRILGLAVPVPVPNNPKKTNALGMAGPSKPKAGRPRIYS